MRSGAEFFPQPGGAAQRRYEALRAYFVRGGPPREVADRFGYSTASVHQMATLLRSGQDAPVRRAPSPGRRGRARPPASCASRVLALRAAEHSVTEIAAALAAEGLPVSAQTVWPILDARGPAPAAAARRDPPRQPGPAGSGQGRPAAATGPPASALPCDHAGLLLLFPAMAELVCPSWSPRPATPRPRAISAWQSIGTLLLAKCARRAPRPPHRRPDRRPRPGRSPSG